MFESSLENLFKFYLKVLEFLGLHLEYGKNWKGTVAKMKFYCILIVIEFQLNIYMAYYTVNNAGNIGEAMRLIPTLVTGIETAMKILSFYFMKDTVRSLIKDLVKFSKKGKFLGGER